MPVFEYKCPACGKPFTELVKKYDEAVKCPACGKQAERIWSGEMHSSTGKPPKRCNGNCSACSGC